MPVFPCRTISPGTSSALFPRIRRLLLRRLRWRDCEGEGYGEVVWPNRATVVASARRTTLRSLQYAR